MSSPTTHGDSRPVPLDRPLYGANPAQAVKRFFQKYAVFSGRASRSEYWWWALVNAIVTGVLQVIDRSMGSGAADLDGPIPGIAFGLYSIPTLLWGLITLVPGIALLSRRLHDAAISAWLILVVLIPVIGAFLLIILAIVPSKPEGARYDRL